MEERATDPALPAAVEGRPAAISSLNLLNYNLMFAYDFE